MNAYQIIENGTVFATITAVDADAALKAAERDYPRNRYARSVEDDDDYSTLEVSVPSPVPTEVTLTMNCRAFGGVMGTHRIIVTDGDDVRVWDSVARHFTSCHSLSKRDLNRIRKAAAQA